MGFTPRQRFVGGMAGDQLELPQACGLHSSAEVCWGDGRRPAGAPTGLWASLLGRGLFGGIAGDQLELPQACGLHSSAEVCWGG